MSGTLHHTNFFIEAFFYILNFKESRCFLFHAKQKVPAARFCAAGTGKIFCIFVGVDVHIAQRVRQQIGAFDFTDAKPSNLGPTEGIGPYAP